MPLTLAQKSSTKSCRQSRQIFVFMVLFGLLYLVPINSLTVFASSKRSSQEVRFVAYSAADFADCCLLVVYLLYLFIVHFAHLLGKCVH
jgi:hypothetical protein